MKRIWLAVLAAGLLCLAGCGGGVRTHEDRVDLSPQAIETLVIKAQDANITLNETDDAPYAQLTVRSYGSRLGDFEELSVTETAENATELTVVPVQRIGTGTVEVSLEVFLPPMAVRKLRVEAQSGTLGCQDFLFDIVSVKLTSGDVLLERVATTELYFSSLSGNVELVDCGAGLVDGKLQSGDFDARFTNGITDLKVAVSSGNIDAAGEFVTVRANTRAGDVRINSLRVPEQLLCKAESGNVSVHVPDTAEGFTAQCTTSSGNFASDFDSKLRDGVLVWGDGAAAFTLESTSGNLTLNKR